MNIQTAWSNFQETGTVEDYLAYSQLKRSECPGIQEAVSYANKHRWPDHQGTNRR